MTATALFVCGFVTGYWVDRALARLEMYAKAQRASADAVRDNNRG